MLAGDTSKTESWKQCDWQYHHALISACGSKALLDAHSAAYDKYLRYQMLAVVFRGQIAAVEHQKLMDAAMRRNFKAAREILHSHIHDCVEHALSKSDWLKPTGARPKAQIAVLQKKHRGR